MPANSQSSMRPTTSRTRAQIGRAGWSDLVFVTVTIVAAVAFSYRTVAGFPLDSVVSIFLRGAYIIFALWYVLVGLRRRRLLALFGEAIEKTPSAFALYDEKDRLVARNSAYEAVHPAAFARLRGTITYRKLVAASLSETLSGEELDRELERRLRRHNEATGVPADSNYDGRWLRVQKARTESGANVGIAIDVTELYEAKAAADREHARFRGLAETMRIGIWHFDADGRTIFANQGLLSLFGLSGRSDIEGVAALDFIAGHVRGFDAARLYTDHDELGNLTVATAEGGTRHIIIRASELPGETPGRMETIMSFVDVTALKEAERRIDYLAHRDTLTGARNRTAFVDAIATASDIASAENPCWLLAIDLDGFKPINDRYGHAAGDELLREFAARMNKAGRPDSFLYRIGGDEFCVLVMGATRDQVKSIGQAMVDAAARPFVLSHAAVSITASIGGAAMPTDAADPETAQRYADLALYSVKNMGGGHFGFFAKEHAERDLEERIMALDLGAALANDEFTFVFQPLFSRADRRVIGVEALLRWVNGRTGKRVPPDVFIAAAERNGVIRGIDHWVFCNVAAQISDWLSRGVDVPLVMINMSPVTFEESDFVARIDRALKNCSAVRDRICIEITEGVAVKDRARLAAIFASLRERGIRTAIDDFGTGQTSVALLRDLPVDFIKIDRTYVSGIESDPQALAIVATIVRLGRELDVTVIAEGVETEAQMRALETAGCDFVQGYLLAFPVGVAEIESTLGTDTDMVRGLTRQA